MAHQVLSHFNTDQKTLGRGLLNCPSSHVGMGSDPKITLDATNKCPDPMQLPWRRGTYWLRP
ncbi:hypothetical protein [Sphingobacterium siyangense]|uniref:hypothetical protein n=1 Tax=Sphingobacterium siyangense TaxID=459529 RepID=UPI0028973CFB|nr:hypothetical protein [Sphingobacterium siyangense]